MARLLWVALISPNDGVCSAYTTIANPDHYTRLSPNIELGSLFGDFYYTYELYRCDRKHKGGGGVALFVRKSFRPYIVSGETVGDEYEIICADLIADDRDLRVVVIKIDQIDQSN